MNYQIQMLDGYTDGRPSWRKVFVSAIHLYRKDTADHACRELREQHPKLKYRVRKVKRKR